MNNDDFYDGNPYVPKNPNIVEHWWVEVESETGFSSQDTIVIHRNHFQWTYIETDGEYHTQYWGVFDDLLRFARGQDVQWQIKRDGVILAQTVGYVNPTSQEP